MPIITRLVFFSEVHGVVLDHGKPVAGAEVERSFRSDWRDIKGVETTKTDSMGRFHFTSYARKSLLVGLIPHQPVTTQDVIIRFEGKIYEAWLAMKYDYEENSELDGVPINMYCDIATKPDHQGKFYGICRIH